MDSLVANYASSDEDENAPPKQLKSVQLNNESHLSSVPPPKKSSIFSYLPPPKSQSNPKHRQTQEESDEQFLQNSNPKSMFSFIPAPKSSPKKVVQFKPPVMLNSNPRSFIDGDDEDDEGEKERLKKKLKDSVSTSSPESFLSTIPAPRYSGALGGSGMGRKSMLETATPPSTQPIDTGANVDSNAGLTGDQSSHPNSGGESNAYYGGYTANGVVDANGVSTGGNGGALNSQGSSEVWSAEHNYDHSGTYSVGETYTVDYSYGGDVEDVQYTNPGVSYGDNVQYEEKWANAATLPTGSDMIPEMQVSGRRRRKDAPPQIIEVKQDELMKNRPREDQVKSTGIAFGPAYQPTSSKGKPTKLHKRKHQIGSLYFDMRQKETELAERRSQGFQTKAQTQAKYGW